MVLSTKEQRGIDIDAVNAGIEQIALEEGRSDLSELRDLVVRSGGR